MDKFGDANLWKSEEMPGKINWMKVSEILFSLLYFVVWSLCLIWFWKGGKGDADGYSLAVFYIILPVATLLLSFYYGFSRNFGIFRWLMLLFFGMMFLLMRYVTFDLCNMLSVKELKWPDWHSFIPGLIISAIGMVLGTGVRLILHLKNKKEKKEVNE